MQADAAVTIPAHAPVAAYLDQLSQPASSTVMAEVLAMEATAVHQVTSIAVHSTELLNKPPK